MPPAPSTIEYLDPYRDPEGLAPLTAEQRAVLRRVNQRIAAKPTLVDVVDFLFDETQDLIPCDRMSFAFVDDGQRVTSRYTRADYEPVLLRTGYSEDLHDSSLERVLATGTPRLIGDLERYAREHPGSRSSRLLVKEGVRASLTCPLVVEGRIVGFIFRSSRQPGVYTRRHVELTMAVTERLGQAVEKAWRIEQLEEANRAYFELLGFVSHELKSPVASLVTDARVMTEGYLGDLDDRQREQVERIAQKGEHIIDLVREYLDLARVESGELTLDVRPDVDLVADVVAPSVDLIGAQVAAEGADLVVDVPRSLPPVECDPALLCIVVTNLLGNAVKYGAPGGSIRLSVQRGPSELTLKVWNQGPGFPSSQRGRLFRRFSRLTTPELKRRRGTGLGLYNARRIIQLHNGRIGADSEEGSWAEFWFSIPQPLGLEPAATPAPGAAS